MTAAPIALSACAASTSPALDAFRATLDSHHSATAALQQWCDTRGITKGEIAAVSAGGPVLPPPDEVRALLGVNGDEPLAYRHVRLGCDGITLSDAHNWYVPARLPSEMNRALETSSIPFGKVIAPLGFTRENVSAYRPGEPRSDAIECPADTVLIQRALLRLADGQPISAVIECYAPAILGGNRQNRK